MANPGAPGAAMPSFGEPLVMDDANNFLETPDTNPGPLGSGRGAIILVAASLMAIGLVMVGSATFGLVSGHDWGAGQGRSRHIT